MIRPLVRVIFSVVSVRIFRLLRLVWCWERDLPGCNGNVDKWKSRSLTTEFRDCIFRCVQAFYEQAVSDLDRSMHRSLWVSVAHSLFIEGSHTIRNTASGVQGPASKISLWLCEVDSNSWPYVVLIDSSNVVTSSNNTFIQLVKTAS